MSNGLPTPMVHGERLRQAREVRQMTAVALAERIGVTGAAVSTWEKGRAQPRGEALANVAATLELPEPFFLRPPCESAPRVFRFRSMSAATKRARSAAEGRLQWLHEIVEMVEREIDLPGIALPDLGLPSDPTKLTDDDVEEAAEKTRRAWGLRDGPIPDITRLLESKGVVVARVALNAAELDGLSALSAAGRPYVFLNSEKASCVRSRFDASHELGHLVMHRGAPERPESSLHKLMESQAHRFAGAFIFPRTAVQDEVARTDLDSLVRLKERWRLSIGAMIYRLHHTGLIDDERKTRLQRLASARGWRTWEPMDSELRAESPTMLRQAYQLMCEGGGWTPADLIRGMPVAHYDHELLAGLPARWMQGDRRSGELVRLRAVPRDEHASSTSEQSAKILRLPVRES